MSNSQATKAIAKVRSITEIRVAYKYFTRVPSGETIYICVLKANLTIK